tara:strand:+ start:105 stop:263 length:159 start_codon:yes stop_codon:yes gene_type:complete
MPDKMNNSNRERKKKKKNEIFEKTVYSQKHIRLKEKLYNNKKEENIDIFPKI